MGAEGPENHIIASPYCHIVVKLYFFTINAGKGGVMRMLPEGDAAALPFLNCIYIAESHSHINTFG